MSIERLVDALRALHPDVSFDELRDVLWLAQHLPGGGPAAPAQGRPPVAPRPGAAAQKSAEPAPPAASPAGPGTAERRRVRGDAGGAGAYAAAQAGTLPVGRAVRRVRLRAPPPLPDALGLARALRPLGRRRLFGRPAELEEVASAEHIAETGLPLPVLRPRRSHWFEVALLIEQAPGLAAWRDQVRAFERLLQRQGGFRSVVPLALAVEGPTITLRSASGKVLAPAVLHERHGRRLVLVVSDCTSPAWHDGRFAAWLAPLAARLPLALVQPFASEVWPHTALGFVEFAVRAPHPGAATGALDIHRPVWAERAGGLVVPVVGMRAADARPWARMLAAAGGAWAPAALLPLPAADDDDDPVRAELDATLALRSDAEPAVDGPERADLARLEAFRAAADPAAHRLAAGLAAVEPITLPVMRLVQHALAPEDGAAVLAQVLASGVFRPRATLTAANEDDVGFEVAPAVRERLASALPRSQWRQLMLTIGRAVEEETGEGFDLLAYLEDGSGADRLPPAARAFAEFARRQAGRYRGAGDGATGRWVDEVVVGMALTVRASHLLSATAERLSFAPDGRLAVRHALGVDVLDARLGRTVERRRRVAPGGQPTWYCAASEAAAISDLIDRCDAEAEAVREQPVRSAITTVEDVFGLHAYVEDQLAPETGLMLMALSHVQVPSAPAERARLRVHLRRLRDELGWLVLPLDDEALDVMPDRTDAAWVGVLARPLDSDASRKAIANLALRIVERLPAEQGEVAAAGWVSASGGRDASLVTIERFSDMPWTIRTPLPPGEVPLDPDEIAVADAGNGGVAIVDGEGRLWTFPTDVPGWPRIGPFAASGVQEVRCSPDGQHVAAIDSDGRLHVIAFAGAMGVRS